MKYELKVIHNLTVSEELFNFFKTDQIDGYTTVSIQKSCGKKDGVFKQDVVSGEKFLTYIWFSKDDYEKAKYIKKKFEERGYFVVFSRLEDE